jgi:hypothetical protein
MHYPAIGGRVPEIVEYRALCSCMNHFDMGEPRATHQNLRGNRDLKYQKPGTAIIWRERINTRDAIFSFLKSVQLLA